MHHEVKFERNTRTGDWKARCSCGWFTIDTEETVQARAATHDIEWQPVEPGRPEAVKS